MKFQYCRIDHFDQAHLYPGTGKHKITQKEKCEMKREGSLGIYILLVTLAAFINGCSGTRSNKNVAGNEVLTDCPDRPNCVSSESQDARHAIEPFRFKGDPTTGWNAITSIIGNLPRTTIVKATDRYLHAECQSRLFGFIDDLELHLDPMTGIIGIRSASRTGYYDFGVNHRRVSNLRQILKDEGLIF
jgi:uncharacterized protein (DUF1499 family)